MKWWTAFIAPDIGVPFHSLKYSTSSVVPVHSVQSRTFVGEDSLGPTPFSACMCMLLYSVVRLHSIVTLRIGVVELRLGCG